AVRPQSIRRAELTVVADMPEQEEGLPPSQALPWGPEDGRREVPSVTLDGAAERLGRMPDFVKVDTEGHEGQVLRGAARILAAGTAGWLIEFHSAALRRECMSLLLAAGYEPETVRHPHYAKGSRMWHEHGWLRAPVPAERAEA